MRAREAFEIMQKEGELGVRKCIVKLAEENSILKQQIREISQITAKLVSVSTMFNIAADEMAKKLEQMDKRYNPDSEAQEDYRT